MVGQRALRERHDRREASTDAQEAASDRGAENVHDGPDFARGAVKGHDGAATAGRSTGPGR
jgi:hypothetical protein